MTNLTILCLVKMECGWNFSTSVLKMMVKSGLGKIFLKFLHAHTMSFLLLNLCFWSKFNNENDMVSAWRNFKNIFPRPLFTIIFRPEMLKFHSYSTLTGDTRVEFVIYSVLRIREKHVMNLLLVFTIFDDFSGNIPLLLIALFEVIGVVYFYGLRT